MSILQTITSTLNLHIFVNETIKPGIQTIAVFITDEVKQRLSGKANHNSENL